MRIPIFCILLLAFVGFSTGNVVSPRLCGGQVFVEDSVVIEISSAHEKCHWDIQTQEDRILVFTVLNGNLKEAQDFLAIHDGSNIDSPILRVENQNIHERSRKDLPASVYTTQSTASVRFSKAPNSNLKLKIQKAIDCPFNLGTESQCGRVVDAVSCYCATFTKRNHLSQRSYCNSHNMKLLSLETYEKEISIHNAWGNEALFLTSLTDEPNEGTWFWESTDTMLYPGYSNWCSKQPDNSAAFGGEDCMMINSGANGCWNDCDCDKDVSDAICQALP